MNTLHPKSSLRKIYKIVLAILGLTTLVLGVMTSGFTVWDRFIRSNPISQTAPVVSISLEPVRIMYNRDFDASTERTIKGRIETDGAAYRFVDSVYIEAFKLVDSSYFFVDYTKPNIDLKTVHFEKMILKGSTSEQTISLDLIDQFILNPNKGMHLYLLKKEELIGNMVIKFPYYFNGIKYIYSVTLPIYVFYGK